MEDLQIEKYFFRLISIILIISLNLEMSAPPGQSSQAWHIIHCLSSYLPIELVKLN